MQAAAEPEMISQVLLKDVEGIYENTLCKATLIDSNSAST